MPHIFVDGEDNERNIQVISLHARVTVKREYHNSLKYQQKMLELQKDMEDLITKYFDDYVSSEQLTNHEFNKIHS